MQNLQKVNKKNPQESEGGVDTFMNAYSFIAASRDIYIQLPEFRFRR